MVRLREKLKSRRGASILLAMLLFLVCCMVAASVLAAAVSNAGKGHSVEIEQQKFLTLSSALQLVTAELEQARYTAQYDVWEWPESKTETVTDADGNVIDTITTTEYFFYCEQRDGVYSCGQVPSGGSKGELTDQLPFGKDLDKFFSQQFQNKGGAGSGFKPLSTDPSPASVTYTLTVSLPDTLPGYSDSAGYLAAKTVTVQAELNFSTHHIILTAWPGTGPRPADNSDTMIAELVAEADSFPALDYNPGARKAKSISGDDHKTSRVCPPTTWTLNSIMKGVS